MRPYSAGGESHLGAQTPGWHDGIGQWRVPAEITLAVAVVILCAGRVDLVGVCVNDSL
jgi:hypothetical protein